MVNNIQKKAYIKEEEKLFFELIFWGKKLPFFNQNEEREREREEGSFWAAAGRVFARVFRPRPSARPSHTEATA